MRRGRESLVTCHCKIDFFEQDAELMAALHHSVVTLRLAGDDLDPSEISALLGATPSRAARKGDIWTGRHSGGGALQKTGKWMLESEYREPEDVEAQIFELLDRLTDDLDIWRSLARYQPNLFCGLFMDNRNDGMILSPRALSALGERGITLMLDIYDSTDTQ